MVQWYSRNSKSYLYENCLLIGELAIRRTKLTLIVPLGTKYDLLIEQLLIGEHDCICIKIVVTPVFGLQLFDEICLTLKSKSLYSSSPFCCS